MQNIKYFFILLALTAMLSSCQDFLDEVPKTEASPENFYKTAEHAEAAVVGAYNALQRNGVYGQNQQYLTTDIIRCANWNTQGGIGTYSFTSENTQVVAVIWREHFKGINEANSAITHIPNIDMDVDRRNTLVAEARFLRALLYFNLVRYYGDVPYMESEVNSLDNLEVPRDPAELVYNKIIADLEFGIEHLDVKGEAAAGRATVGSAKTLLAKVYLTRGSMTKRDGKGDGLSDFQAAATLAGEVITDGGYQLCEYFPDAFIVENKNNDEIIFDVQFKSGGLNEGNYIGMHMGLQGPPALGGSWGNIISTQYFHTIYEPTDLVRQEWTSCHVRVQGNGTLRTDYAEMFWESWKIGKFRRYPVRNPDFVFSDHDIHWPVLRYSEVFLIYAEALNEVNNGPTDEVFAALNELRKRARNVNGDGTREYLHEDYLPRDLTYDANILPDISSLDFPDYESMKEYIMLERARELGGECKRWFDLVRWGKLVENIKFIATYTPPGRTRPEDQWATTANNVSDHHMLLPIPISEMNANPALEQNPGY
ncbi:RagB/SusD family nutrient uptake outer membrane protein [Carboxylicivirga sp. A043]|uniref:RagB/SusD family nutrient uptake outer membrane protein n=1 Tax=Carboxylicivirga litoralis TaxID=2816963 RepID=UPI0021CB1359|nr:RagB/SusD family nutrient uptake outer membrane protein [Carboxylicivirga sp. A043]MCU4157871.1 RagB/SusD family nutrient uptake outer membrane protein [Carboxylicivirga sp. A043]